MHCNTHFDPRDMCYNFTVIMNSHEIITLTQEEVINRAIDLAAAKVAKVILEDKFQEIYEKINVQAVSNLAVAKAGTQIGKEIHGVGEEIRKMPRRSPRLEPWIY